MTRSELICSNCGVPVAREDVISIALQPGIYADYHSWAEDPSLPCGPLGEAVFVGPEPGTPICWTCEKPIDEGQGRNKHGWLVHHLCPIPEVVP